jgi:arylsulfatase A-like enzyme
VENVSDKPPWVARYARTRQALIDEGLADAQESLEAVDDAVRSIVTALTDTGRMSNTLFVFLSDNGLLMGEHHLFTWKNLPYKMSTAIPMTIRWDGHLAPNTIDRRLALNIDVAPTIAQATGVPLAGSDGLSLLDSTTRAGFPLEAVAWRRYDSLPRHPAYCGYRTARYTYVQYASGEQELYDYRVDPDEVQNRAYFPSYEQTLLELRRRAIDECSPTPPGFSWPSFASVAKRPPLTVIPNSERPKLGPAHDD